MRGLAILLVLSGHLFSEFYIFRFGWIGLNLFFVLSGFLITGRLFYHLQETPAAYFRNFYGRRILRIFPLYYACLVGFFLLLPLFYKDYLLHFSAIYSEQSWYWLYAVNWFIFLNGLPQNPVFFHFWSLAVEEQFYILWPVIFLFCNMLSRKILIIAIIFLSIVVRVLTDDPGQSYYSTLTASEPLLLGALLSIWQKQSRLESNMKLVMAGVVFSVSGLLVIFYLNSDLHITNTPLMKYGYSAINFIWFGLLFLMLLANSNMNLIRRLFSTTWLVWMGKYAYGIYVFHWIILQLFVNNLENFMRGNGFSGQSSYFIIRTIAVIFILVISVLSYHLYEKPFLKLKKYFD